MIKGPLPHQVRIVHPQDVPVALAAEPEPAASAPRLPLLRPRPVRGGGQDLLQTDDGQQETGARGQESDGETVSHPHDHYQHFSFQPQLDSHR